MPQTSTILLKHSGSVSQEYNHLRSRTNLNTTRELPHESEGVTSELLSEEYRSEWAGTVSTLTPLIAALVTISLFYLDRLIRIGGVDVLYAVALMNLLISALAGGIGGLFLRPTCLGRRLCHAILLAWLGVWSYGGFVIFGIVIIELLRFWVPNLLI